MPVLKRLLVRSRSELEGKTTGLGGVLGKLGSDFPNRTNFQPAELLLRS